MQLYLGRFAEVDIKHVICMVESFASRDEWHAPVSKQHSFRSGLDSPTERTLNGLNAMLCERFSFAQQPRLADKERVAAALENPALRNLINNGIA